MRFSGVDYFVEPLVVPFSTVRQIARTSAGVISRRCSARPCAWMFAMTSDLDPRVVQPHLQVTSINTIHSLADA